MNPNTWYRGRPLEAQEFLRFNAREMNEAYAADIARGWEEVPIPVDGDKTAITRSK